MESIKMNTLLAKAEHSASVFKKEVGEYLKLFKNNQGMFKGIRKTHVPREGFVEDSTKIGTINVQSTVDEQFNWFIQKVAEQYLDEQFSIEATNSLGALKIELKVGEHSFGNLTALELMRLKSILTDSTFDQMLNAIPVRSDAEVWTKSQAVEYANREVYETPMIKGVTRTTESEEFILDDPNINPDNVPSNYRAQISTKKKLVETGDYTTQTFSGEWTQTQKAELLARKSELLSAVIVALKDLNAAECTKTNLNTKDLLNFIFKGK